MRILSVCFGLFLATLPAFGTGWLTNESNVVALVKDALPFGLNIQMSEILDLACAQSGLNWRIGHSTIFIYDNTEQAGQHVQLTLNRQKRDETDYVGQGVSEDAKAIHPKSGN